MSQVANVLIVEDDANLRDALTDTLSLAGFNANAVASGEDAISQLGREKPDLVVSDMQMDGMNGDELLKNVRQRYHDLPFVLMTAYGNVNSAVNAIQQGASDYLEKPFSPKVLVDIVEKYITRGKDIDLKDVVARDPLSIELFELAKRVAQSDVSVLLTGPSGTGKEVLSRYIHNNSHRAKMPFVAINCAAIPENMLEATLFGYEKGAFTGAHQANPGKFEQAQHGTILLDEISEMDLGLQAKLLRVLQEKEVERIGGRKSLPLDVRVIATSNRSLLDEVKAQRFREDLYYRLNVFPIQCLALRDRREDIVPLCDYMISKHAARDGGKLPQLSNSAKQALKAYPWPGNVRELENVVQRALILHRGDYIEIADLQLKHHQGLETLPVTKEVYGVGEKLHNDPDQRDLVRDVKNHEFTLIAQALKTHEGSRKAVSETLGISPRTLRYKIAKMRELGFDIP